MVLGPSIFGDLQRCFRLCLGYYPGSHSTYQIIPKEDCRGLRWCFLQHGCVWRSVGIVLHALRLHDLSCKRSWCQRVRWCSLHTKPSISLERMDHARCPERLLVDSRECLCVQHANQGRTDVLHAAWAIDHNDSLRALPVPPPVHVVLRLPCGSFRRLFCLWVQTSFQYQGLRTQHPRTRRYDRPNGLPVRHFVISGVLMHF